MRRTLAARLDNCGDVLLTGPAVRALAERSDEVCLLCGPRGAPAADLLPGVDEVLVHTAEWIDPEPEPIDRGAIDALVAAVRDRFDEAVIFTSFHQSALPLALLLRLAGVERVSAISDDYPGSLLDVRHRVPDDLHEVERALSLAEAAGFPLPPGDDRRLRVELGSGDGPAGIPPYGSYVAIHPGASVPARCWSGERHAQVAAALARRGVHVVVTGAASERELTAHVVEAARSGCSSAQGSFLIDRGGQTDLAGMARVVAGAAVIVTGNTGPAHLAAAVGTPVVSIYAPTVPARRWRPWMVPHVLLGDQDIPCAGCRARHCPVDGHPCIEHVSPASVVAAIEHLWPDGAGSVAGRGAFACVP